jgi:hypothetical protein
MCTPPLVTVSACPECARLTAENEKLKAFETAVCRWIHNDIDAFFGSEASEDMAEAFMAPLGYFEKANYDPDKHGEMDIDPGEQFWHFTDKFMAAVDRSTLNRKENEDGKG